MWLLLGAALQPDRNGLLQRHRNAGSYGYGAPSQQGTPS
jgi:hypothetical protein